MSREPSRSSCGGESDSGSASGSDCSCCSGTCDCSWSEDLGPKCVACGNAGGGELLLKCGVEGCEVAVHSFCLSNPLGRVCPMQSWRCARCYDESGDEAGSYKKLPRIKRYRKTKQTPLKGGIHCTWPHTPRETEKPAPEQGA